MSVRLVLAPIEEAEVPMVIGEVADSVVEEDREDIEPKLELTRPVRLL